MHRAKVEELDVQWLRDAFLAFEEKHTPFQLLVDDFSLWPKLRFLTFERLRDQLGDFTPRPSSNQTTALIRRFRKTASLWDLPFQYRKLLRLCSSTPKPEILAFTSVDRLRDNIAGTHRNYCLDFFEPPLNRMLSVYGTEVKSASLDSYRGNFIKNSFQDYFRIREMLTPRHENKDLRLCYERFSQHMLSAGWPLLPRGLFQIWLNTEKQFKAELAAGRLLLDRVKPRLVLIDTGYGREGTIAAAKVAGIPTWELQHGMLGPEHMGYMYEKSCMPSTRDQLPFPDRFIAYGEHFRDLVSESGYCAPGGAVALGSPRLEYFRKSFAPLCCTDRPFRALISSQWILADSLKAFLQAASARLSRGIELIVKPHPLDSDEIVRQYKKMDNSISVLPKSIPFYEALEGCHVHASIFSTTLFESVGMSVPTIVLGLPGWTNARTLVETGAAKFVPDPLAFSEFLNRLESDQLYFETIKQGTKRTSGYFWSRNPGNRFQEFLAEELTHE